MPDPVEITFHEAGARDLKLDLFRPATDPLALIVMVHGGGWRRGSRSGIRAYGEVFANLGFAAIVPEYRLLDENPWPAQLDDVKAAATWATTATQLGVPAGRVVLLGFSAGGYLALLAADDLKPKVAAVIALFPPVELVAGAPAPGQTAADQLLAERATEAAARSASPLHRAGQDFPPTFLIHGAEDWVVPHLTSQRMFDALMAAGVNTELHLYAGHTHESADAPYMMKTVAGEVANFLYRTVIDPAGAQDEDLRYNPFAHGPEGLRSP